MLLVEAPDRSRLLKVVEDLLAGYLSREEVASWQKAVFAQYTWDISIPEDAGYWYFYGLSFINLPFPGGFFLREQDLREYRADLSRLEGEAVTEKLVHRRSWQLDRKPVRWPLAIVYDESDLMARLPGCRGTFEKRMDMVEHCHLAFEGINYLMVKQFDEQASQILLLGNSRDKRKAEHLVMELSLDNALVNYLF